MQASAIEQRPSPQTVEVCAVVVTFDPERERLAGLLDAVSDQVAHLIIVDNGSSAEHRVWITSLLERMPLTVRWIPLRSNSGVAKAQNIGIEAARPLFSGKGLAAILLLDHDSLPAPGMVGELSRALMKLDTGPIPVAAVGANFIDARQGHPPPFVRVRGLNFVRMPCPAEADVVACDYLIASGSLTPLKVFDAVGMMDDSLFIDYVDTEWGLRAGMKGYQCYGVCNARMEHALGDPPMRFGKRRIASHSPTRHYYMARNALLLYRRDDLPRRWKLADAVRLSVRLTFYALFARPRRRHASMIIKGLIDGMRGCGGSIDSAGVRKPARP